MYKQIEAQREAEERAREVERMRLEEMERQRQEKEARRQAEDDNKKRQEAEEAEKRRRFEARMRAEAEARRRAREEATKHAEAEEAYRQAEKMAEDAQAAALREEMEAHDRFVRRNIKAIEDCAFGDAAVAIAQEYERKWQILRAAKGTNFQCRYGEFPFPVFFPADIPPLPIHITYNRVCTFVLSPQRNSAGRSPRARVLAEILRWHPDHFTTDILPKIDEGSRAVVEEAAKVVVRCLNQMKDDLLVMRGI